ncbi:MAG: hypothetical protein NVSMB21_05860 [Vulcanimicrobiaceae bacterium]
MLSRIETGDAPLATTDPPRAIAAPPTTGTVVRLPDGDVAANLRPLEENRHHATYELIVANDTSAPLASFTYAVAASGGRLTWNAVVVPPFSAVAVEIDVARSHRRPPRVVAELYAGQAQLVLDAPPPRRRGRSRGAAIVAAALLAATLGAATAATRTHVVALAAPTSVRADTPFSVAYALADATGARYTVDAADGTHVREGVLGERGGAFEIALPPGATSSGYDVRVYATGRFGADERSTHVVALPNVAAAPKPKPRVAVAAIVPPAPAPPLRLGTLSLEHDVVHGGESIVVGYPATGDPGMVRLIDALGTVRVEALLTRRGRSILVAPHVDADQDFRIVATVERGSARDEVTTPVTVLHTPAAPSVPAGPPPAALVAAAAATTPLAAATVKTPQSAAPIAVDREQRVGRDIIVRIDRFQRDLHVALLGPSSEELAGSDVEPGQRSVILRTADVPAAAHYQVVATFASTLGQETLVRPIVLRAR